MRRPPFSPREGVFSRGAGRQTVWTGLLIGGLALAVGAWYYFGGRANWQTMVFTSLAFAQIGQAFATRSNSGPVFPLRLRSNPLLLTMALTVFVLQLAVIYLPPLQSFFNTRALYPLDLAVAIGAGVLVFAVLAFGKTRR